ncbi:hypothetical protein AAG570_002018 [Ranatra chinensis]|uniref:Carboxypeptidase n=1 Tax=Ranatra chinensis TaxID=642074 RepID=A0ABD0YA87_9HEMI
MPLREVYPVWEPLPVETKGVGEPLILTEVVKEKNAQEARAAARVLHPDIANLTDSYSGFITVDPKYNSNLFFWYFPTQSGKVGEDPLVVWLQGGPGASSLYGLFEEIGPLSIAENDTLYLNPYSWHRNQSLLFIDNPVGTGFSFTDSDEGYARRQEQIGEQLYVFLIQFFKIFPELQPAPFFIAGESYAGKHIPSIGYEIHKRNPSADLWINLQGLAIGNGFTDPGVQSRYSDFAYQTGLVDKFTYSMMQLAEQHIRLSTAEANYTEAHMYWMLDLGLIAGASNRTDYYNILSDESPRLDDGFASLVQSDWMRAALHVGEKEFTSIGKVYAKLQPDFMRSARPYLEGDDGLISNYRVMFYNGQLDLIVAYPLSTELYHELKFNGSHRYPLAKRRPWRLTEDDGKAGVLAGYLKRAANLYDVMVRGAGHMVPMDKPRAAFDLINKFTRNTL